MSTNLNLTTIEHKIRWFIMKKIILVFLIISLFFTACDQPAKKTEDNNEAKQTEEKEPVVEAKETEEAEPTEKMLDTQTPNPDAESVPGQTSDTLPMTVGVVVARDSYAPSELNPVLDALEEAGYEPIIMSDIASQAN